MLSLEDWRFFALASAIFAGLTAIFGKMGVSEMNSNLATFIRTVVILAVSFFIVTFQNQWKWPSELSRRSLIFLLLSGVATGLSWLCYYRALQLGPVSKVAPLDKLSVVFALGLSALVLGESVSWQTGLGTLLIVGGTVLIGLA